MTSLSCAATSAEAGLSTRTPRRSSHSSSRRPLSTPSRVGRTSSLPSTVSPSCSQSSASPGPTSSASIPNERHADTSSSFVVLALVPRTATLAASAVLTDAQRPAPAPCGWPAAGHPARGGAGRAVPCARASAACRRARRSRASPRRPGRGRPGCRCRGSSCSRRSRRRRGPRPRATGRARGRAASRSRAGSGSAAAPPSAAGPSLPRPRAWRLRAPESALSGRAPAGGPRPRWAHARRRSRSPAGRRRSGASPRRSCRR